MEILQRATRDRWICTGIQLDRALLQIVAMRKPCDDGMTLIEVCLAVLIVSIAAFGAAHLFGQTLKMIAGARMQSAATMLAAQRVEQIRASGWQAAGSVTTVAVSPANSLAVNSPGFVEYFDQHGQSVGTGPTPPPSAVYICRWFVDAHPWSPSQMRVIRALATSVARDAQAQPGAARRRLADEALVTTIVTRKVQ